MNPERQPQQATPPTDSLTVVVNQQIPAVYMNFQGATGARIVVSEAVPPVGVWTYPQGVPENPGAVFLYPQMGPWGPGVSNLGQAQYQETGNSQAAMQTPAGHGVSICKGQGIGGNPRHSGTHQRQQSETPGGSGAQHEEERRGASNEQSDTQGRQN